LDSGSTPEVFAKREVELGSGVITCTDHGSLAAAQQIYSLGKKYNLTPVIGLEGYFRDDNCPILKDSGIAKTDIIPRGMDSDKWKTEHPDGSFFEYLKYQHITTHFMDYAAYQKGVQLLSRADARAERHGSELKPLFEWSDIEELAAQPGTVATSSCLIGMIQRHLFDAKKPDIAKKYFDRMLHLFGDRFYVEVFPHACTHNWSKAILVKALGPDGSEHDLKFYFTKKIKTTTNLTLDAEDLEARFNGGERLGKLAEISHYRKWVTFERGPFEVVSVERREGFFRNECSPVAPDGDIQWGCNKYVLAMAEKNGVKVLIADDSHFAYPEEKIYQDVRLAQSGDWKFHNSYHRQTSEEAWHHFRDKLDIKLDMFEGWVDNTQEWASRFKNFKLETSPSLPTKFFPSDSLKFTKELILKNGRMPQDPKYLARLKLEIDILHKNGTIDLLPYFHIDEEVCKLYENQGWLTGPGRGSAAGLLICYLLGITHIDPIKYGLSLERFITLDRIKSGKMPDIDQDLPFREPLAGQDDVNVVEFEAEDGSKHILPEDFRIETDMGLLTVRQALAQGADIAPWWESR